MELFSDAWVIAVLQIVAIDIVLGGDNAIIIALACRNLPKHQKRAGILWGTTGAIILRVILVFFATSLMEIPRLAIDWRRSTDLDWREVTHRSRLA
jgi:predicted tellurium resistance membrane protein TerC